MGSVQQQQHVERGCDRSKRSIESASSDDDDDDDDDDRHLKERRKANSRADLISALSVCLSG